MFFLVGVIFVPLGVGFLVTSNGVSTTNIVVCPAERRERNATFCRELIVLPGSCVSVWTPTCTSTHRQFIICLIYSSKLHSKPDFVFKDYILKFYLQC